MKEKHIAIFLAFFLFCPQGQARSVNVELFNNSHSPDYIMVEDSLRPEAMGGRKTIFSANYNYVDDPAVVTNDERTERKRPLIHGMGSLHLGAGHMLTPRLLVGASTFATKVIVDRTHKEYTTGDSNLLLKYRITGASSDTSAAIIPEVILPTGDKDFLLTNDSIGVGLKFAVERDFKLFRLTANAGFLHHDNARLVVMDYRNRLLGALGVQIPIVGDKWAIASEISGSRTLPFNRYQNPGELYFGTRYQQTSSLSFTGGVSFGGPGNVGGNDFRILAGLKFIPESGGRTQVMRPGQLYGDASAIEQKIHRISIENDINFKHDSAELTDTGKQALKEIAKVLNGSKQAYEKVRILGDANRIGSDAYNLVLSRARAESVKGFLVDQGIMPVALDVEGFGESKPKQHVKDEQLALELNRRVEFQVLKNH